MWRRRRQPVDAASSEPTNENAPEAFAPSASPKATKAPDDQQ
jgi:hypothetical protein